MLIEAKDQAARRIAVRDAVKCCDRCALRRSCSGPVPFSGPMSVTAAVLGEAPGAQEDQVGRPFVGPAGQLLRRLLFQTGIDADSLAYLNTVSCFPGRTPTAREIDACTPNRLAQLDVLSPIHLLVTGTVALSAVRPDLKITDAHGRLFSDVPGRWVFPVHHPSAALRNPQLVDVLAKDLGRWAQIIRSDRPHDFIPLSCVACGRLADRYDPDGVGWCPKHLGRGLRGWGRSRSSRTQQAIPPIAEPTVQDIATQGALL